MHGQPAKLYVREVAPGGGASLPVVLFVHGAGTPAEVSFDSRMEDYSWMRQVARAGFDVFSVSLTGYGRSTRPPQMADPCNIVKSAASGVRPRAVRTHISHSHCDSDLGME
jgi:pimeloyl-ACP methyl ester carboxylesterase